VLFIIAAFLGAIGSVLLQSGAEKQTASRQLHINERLLDGVVCSLLRRGNGAIRGAFSAAAD